MGVSQKTQKTVLAVFIFINGLLTPGGMIYGWPGLAQMLKDSWQYTSECPADWTPHGDVKCPSQDRVLGNIFTVAANVATLSTVFYGFTLDRYGVRSNAISGAIMMSAGFFMLAFGDSVKFDAFLPAFALIAWGGLGTYLPAFQFAQLFERPTLILAVQSALFGLSGLLFTFFKYLLEEHGVSRETSFTVYGCIVAACGLNMALLYPAEVYRPGDLVHLPVLGWLGLEPVPKRERVPLLVEPVVDSLNDKIHGASHSSAAAAHDEPAASLKQPLNSHATVEIIPTTSSTLASGSGAGARSDP